MRQRMRQLGHQWIQGPATGETEPSYWGSSESKLSYWRDPPVLLFHQWSFIVISQKGEQDEAFGAVFACIVFSLCVYM